MAGLAPARLLGLLLLLAPAATAVAQAPVIPAAAAATACAMSASSNMHMLRYSPISSPALRRYRMIGVGRARVSTPATAYRRPWTWLLASSWWACPVLYSQRMDPHSPNTTARSQWPHHCSPI